MMTRLVKLAFYFMLFSIIGLVVAPGFIDWNKHRGLVMEKISSVMQRKITIEGNISFRVLPQPEILLENVTLDNIASRPTPFIQAKQIAGRIKLSPIFEGRFEIETVDIIDAIIQLESTKDGAKSWDDVLKDNVAANVNAAHIQLNQVNVKNATIHYLDETTGNNFKVEKTNLAISAPTLNGPYTMKGDLAYRQIPIQIDAASEVYVSGKVLPVRFDLKPLEQLPEISFSGAIDQTNGTTLQGEVTIKQGRLASLWGDDAYQNIPFLNEIVDWQSNLELKNNQLSLSDIKAKIGKGGSLVGKVGIAFSSNHAQVYNVDISATNLRLASDKNRFFLLPANVSGAFKMKGDNIASADKNFKKINLSANLSNRLWNIDFINAEVADLYKAEIKGIADPIKETAQLSVQLQTDTVQKINPSIPFNKLDIKTRADISADKIILSDIDADIENGLKLSGSITSDLLQKYGFYTANVVAYNGDLTKIDFSTLKKSNADIDLSIKNAKLGTTLIQEGSAKLKVTPELLSIEQSQFKIAGADLTEITAVIKASDTKTNYEIKGALNTLPFDLTLDQTTDEYSGVLNTSQINLKEWASFQFWPFNQKQLTLAIKAPLLLVGDYKVIQPDLTLEYKPDSLTAKLASGLFEGGSLTGMLSIPERSWGDAIFYGALTNIDTAKIATVFNFKNIGLGLADIELKQATLFKDLKTAKADLVIKLKSLELEGFNYSKTGTMLDALNVKVDGIDAKIVESLQKNGKTVFSDVSVPLSLQDGFFELQSLKLSNVEGILNVKGKIHPELADYIFDAELLLTTPKNIPAIKIGKSSTSGYTVNATAAAAFTNKHLPEPVAIQPEIKAVPAPAEAKPPVESVIAPPQPTPAEPAAAINDILNRLDADVPKPVEVIPMMPATPLQ